MFKGKRAMLCATAGWTMMASPAFAQEAESDSAANPDEIVVTATLRSQNLQDIPIAVTALSQETFERQGVLDIKLISSVAPSISVYSTQTETQGTSIRIRGVGTTGNNTGLESSVGVFIDGVYLSRPGVALGDLTDIERIEILRGPQGTLFGRNTSAGAVTITTRQPNLSEFEGFANASYGNYDLVNVQGGVSVPIARDLAALRISGSYRNRDGFLRSSTGAENNDRNRWMLRGQLLIEPTSNMSVRIIGDYSDIDEKCCDGVVVRETELAPFFAANGLPNDGVANFGFGALRDLSSNSEQFFNGAEQWGVSGDVRWDLGDVKLTYIGSYREFDSFSVAESDFVSLQLFTNGAGGVASVPGIPQTGDLIKTFTQELRLQGSAFGGVLDWLVGAYYSDEDIVSDQTYSLGRDFQAAASAFNFGPLTASPPPGGTGPNPAFAFTALGNGGVPVNAAGTFSINRFLQDARSYSFFTHNIINLTDSLSLTLGARYVNERKVASFDQLGGSGAACQATVNGALTGAIPAAFGGPLVGINCFGLAAPVTITAPASLGGGLASNFLPLVREWADTFKDDELTYTIQLAYKPNSDLLFYGGFSHGFKSGGFNLDPTAALLVNSSAVLTTRAAPVFADPRFRSEGVDAYELGFKGTFGRINANLALFQMNITDYQVLDFTGVQFQTFNVAAGRSRGAELEVSGQLHRYISGNFSVSYTDANYARDCAKGIPAATRPTVERICGLDFTNAPEWTGVAGLTYDGPIGSSGWQMLVNGNLY